MGQQRDKSFHHTSKKQFKDTETSISSLKNLMILTFGMCILFFFFFNELLSRGNLTRNVPICMNGVCGAYVCVK